MACSEESESEPLSSEESESESSSDSDSSELCSGEGLAFAARGLVGVVDVALGVDTGLDAEVAGAGGPLGVDTGFDAGAAGAGGPSSSSLESSHDPFTSAAVGAGSSLVGSGAGAGMGSGVSSFGGRGSGVWGTELGAGEPPFVGPAFLRELYTGRLEGAADCCSPSICAPDASKACLRISAAR